MIRTVALTGISGVGKSTLIKLLSASIEFEHLQASALIKSGRNGAGDAVTQDQLRSTDLNENQRFLIDGFRLAIESKSGLIILDGHTVIEKGDEIVRIGAFVFREIGISSMIFLEDDPLAIAERRRGDTNRIRPLPDVDKLTQIQNVSREQAAAICHSLGIALLIHRPHQHAAIARALTGDGFSYG
jgi:adenylate kinase